jgi:hypothetical protein
MSRHVFDVPLARGMQRGAKATRPVFAFPQVFDHLFGMRARLAAVALFVVLVE